MYFGLRRVGRRAPAAQSDSRTGLFRRARTTGANEFTGAKNHRSDKADATFGKLGLSV
jgi:hypothetical protein